MSTDFMPLLNVQDRPDTVIVRNGDHRASVASERTGRNINEIERLPFDLSVVLTENSICLVMLSLGLSIRKLMEPN
ncbi:MAG: hypothetical protein L0220_24090 [Acidobacteria bacterium]|nr:hypothetical protein [Acidobacteriota bacterium]